MSPPGGTSAAAESRTSCAAAGGDSDLVAGASRVAVMAAMLTTAIPVAAKPARERAAACMVAPFIDGDI
jgi:hypothetical protein